MSKHICESCFREYDEELAIGVCPYCGYYEGIPLKDPRVLPIGCKVKGRYIVGGVIGEGGFGITYYAWDETLKVVVALKEFYQSGVVNRIPGTKDIFIAARNREEEFNYGKSRLLHEAQVVSKFQSANIVRVNDYFEENGTTYMVMEFLDSDTLTERLIAQNRPMTPDEVTKVGIQLCEALDEIHRADVLHRDIAPDNIFINEENQVKIIDFGSSRLTKTDTLEHLILVKEGFSPIEQYEALDPAHPLQQEYTDIYALGAVLYYCLTGIRPAESRKRKNAVDNGEPDIREPKELNENIPENLNNTIMKAMAINAHERFSSAQEMKQALSGNMQVEPLAVIRKKKKRKRAVTIGAAFAAAVVIMLIAFLGGKKQYDDITLEAASVSFWYCTKGADFTAAFDKETGEWDITEGYDAEGEMLMDVLKEKAASAQFDLVDVSLRGIPEEVYESTLISAFEKGEMPSIFAFFDDFAGFAPYMADIADASGIISHLDDSTRNCYLLKNEISLFKEKQAIPTGFERPVLYVNDFLVDSIHEGAVVKNMQDLSSFLENAHYLTVSYSADMEASAPEILKEINPEILSVCEFLPEEDFFAGDSALYIAGASDYLNVRNYLPGRCHVLVPESEPAFCDYWAMSKGDKNDTTAAEVLLSYLYTENAQDIMYSRVDADALPLNKNALNKYLDVYDELSPVKDNLK